MLLLDTHIVLWAMLDDRRLSEAARRQIEIAGAGVWVSAVSIWEMAIKYRLKRRFDPMPVSGSRALEMVRNSGFQLLDVRAEHAAAVEDLPPLHDDPFDRLLLAQARIEPLRLMTADERLVPYGHEVLKV